MIKIGILGYGNLGKGVEVGIQNNPDMELVGVFTRRNPDMIHADHPVYHIDDLISFKDKIDVLILCGGSYSDIPAQGPDVIRLFHTVDSFDTHANIAGYYSKMHDLALDHNKVAFISFGWDPGLFSLVRVLFISILPNSKEYCFYGTGVSQGHSDAIRRINGVEDAIQYTIPVDEVVRKIRSGKTPDVTVREKHRRVCYVVAKEGYDTNQIKQKILSMPNYFKDNDTEVHFISKEERKKNHDHLNHGGFVFTNGITSADHHHTMELSLSLDSNPEFTASILLVAARANYRFQQEQKYGAHTILDIPISYFSPLSKIELIKKI